MEHFNPALAVDLGDHEGLHAAVKALEAERERKLEPWDCAKCLRGRGRGSRNGNRHGWPWYEDELCSLHANRTPMPRNRAERRRLEHEYERQVRRETRRLVRAHRAQRDEDRRIREAAERAADRLAESDRAWVNEIHADALAARARLG